MDIEQLNKLLEALNGVSERLDHMISLNSEMADNQMMLLKLLKSKVTKAPKTKE